MNKFLVLFLYFASIVSACEYENLDKYLQENSLVRARCLRNQNRPCFLFCSMKRSCDLLEQQIDELAGAECSREFNETLNR